MTVVVSLLAHDESVFLGLEDEGAAINAGGLRFENFPIPDHSLPEDPAAFLALADRLVAELGAGHFVGVHCRAGIGRSALLTTAVLLKLGHTLPGALDSISRARGVTVPDTTEQREWLATLPTGRLRRS